MEFYRSPVTDTFQICCIIAPIISNDYCWKLLHCNPTYVKDDRSITTLLCYYFYMNTVVDFRENLNFILFSTSFAHLTKGNFEWHTNTDPLPLFTSLPNALICSNCLICYKLEYNCN